MAIKLPPAVELARRLEDAYERRDWDAVRRCYHDKALLCTVASRAEPVGPDETIELLQRYAEHTPFQVSSKIEFRRVDEDACMAEARARYPLETGGIADSNLCWLMTFKDGFLYRIRVFKSRSDAYQTYLSDGLTLGIGGD